MRVSVQGQCEFRSLCRAVSALCLISESVEECGVEDCSAEASTECAHCALCMGELSTRQVLLNIHRRYRDDRPSPTGMKDKPAVAAATLAALFDYQSERSA
ncbi:unnamed protein product [Lota lota]